MTDMDHQTSVATGDIRPKTDVSNVTIYLRFLESQVFSYVFRNADPANPGLLNRSQVERKPRGLVHQSFLVTWLGSSQN